MSGRDEVEDAFAQFVRLLPEPALLVQPNGTVLLANDAFGKLVGAPATRISGQSLHSVVDDPPHKIDAFLRLASRTPHLVPGSFHWRSSANHSVSMRCDAALLVPRAEQTPALLFLRCRTSAESTDPFSVLSRKVEALSKEIIERKKVQLERDRLLESEREARVNAEQVNRMKDEFLATVSHELRTPLTAILGWAHLLQHPDSGEERRRAGLLAIERNARAQARIIEDLLDMSRIISGKIRLDVQAVHPAAVVEAAVDAIRPAAEAKDIRLQLALDPLAGPIKADPGRLQQVLWNLLSNAVKFTRKGGRIHVVLERVNSHIEISVTDDGEGIAPEFLPFVFDRFRQQDGSTTRRHGGLGVGLSVVKHLVELHGGSVRAKSGGIDCGACFTVALPLLAALPESEDRHPQARSDSDVALAADELRGVRVLVIDDEPDARDLLQALLLERGAMVQAAECATTGLQAIDGFAPDIILCDIGMPNADGYEFVRALRTLPPVAGGRSPAVAVTAFARSEDRARAMLAGFDAHLAKPLEPTELIATVAGLTRRSRGAQ